MTGFDYAQARLQAHYSRHPTRSLWNRLAAARSLAAYIEAARATSIAPWVENISRGGDVHDIEHSIRGSFNSAAEQTASWIPEAWRPATRWLTWLPYLPALDYLLRGEPLLHWMGEGHRLRPFAHQSLSARRRALLQQGHGWALDAGQRGLPLTTTWCEAWADLWPVKNGRLAEELRRLQGMVETHLHTFGSLRSDQTAEARLGLREPLRRTFRNHTASPLAVYAYLGLLALDLERLRGELVRRALFPQPEAT